MSETSGTLQKWALLIGINDYPNAPKLNGSVNDVLLTADILQNSFGFTMENMTVLRDADATRDGILAAMDRLVSQVQPDDVVVFYFSGQGSQLPDPTSVQPDGFVSTIFPYDSGRDPHPVRDITYAEIYNWVVQFRPITPQVILIVDTNHAGGISPTRETWGKGEMQYVFLGACRNDENAYEFVVEGVSHGAFTYSLRQALEDAGPDTTYRAIYQQIAAQVGARFTHQHPWIEGDVDRLLFGEGKVESMRFVRVLRRARDTVTISAGAATGITARSQWAIYPTGTRQVTSATRKLGVIEIAEVGAVESEARILSESDRHAIAEGTLAVEEAHNYSDMRLVIKIQDEAGLGFAVEALARLLQDSVMVRLAASDEQASVTAWIVPQRAEVRQGDPVPALGAVAEPTWAIVDNSGQFVMPTYPAGNPQVVWNLRENLERLSRWFNVLGLKNPNINSPLLGEVDLILKRQTPDGAWVVAAAEAGGGLPAYADGEQVSIDIVNHHESPLFVTVLDFPPDGSMAVLFPEVGGSQAVPPGETLTFLMQVYVLSGLPVVPAVNSDAGSVGVETLKLFATTYPTDFTSLLLQDGMRSSMRQFGENTVLWQLLDLALTGYGSRDLRPVTLPIDQEWTTVERSFDLRRTRSAVDENRSPQWPR